jgi:hypothetical protein
MQIPAVIADVPTCRQLWSAAASSGNKIKPTSKQRSPAVAEVDTGTVATSVAVPTIGTCLRPLVRVLAQVAAGASNPSWNIVVGYWLLATAIAYWVIVASSAKIQALI